MCAHLPAGTGLATTSGAYPHSYRPFLSQLVLVNWYHYKEDLHNDPVQMFGNLLSHDTGIPLETSSIWVQECCKLL